METLREIRKKAQLTQIQAAKLCGVSRRTYQTYEEQNLERDDLYKIIKEMGINEFGPAILNPRYIKMTTSEIFAKYPQVQCAYLFGSYARGEATAQSDVDILVVAPGLGGFDFSGLHFELRTALHKDVDLVKHTTLMKSEKMLRDILNQGVQIYGQGVNQRKNR